MINRRDCRDTLANLVEGEVPSVQQVYRTLTNSFAGQSPVICITSGSSNRVAFTSHGSRARIVIVVHMFVLQYDEESGWTEENAEDMLDQIEYEFGSMIERHQETDYWKAVDWEGASLVDKVDVSGKPYLYEMIPLIMEAV